MAKFSGVIWLDSGFPFSVEADSEVEAEAKAVARMKRWLASSDLENFCWLIDFDGTEEGVNAEGD